MSVYRFMKKLRREMPKWQIAYFQSVCSHPKSARQHRHGRRPMCRMCGTRFTRTRREES